MWFRWGEGEVFHMISHYYLQRTELRTQRHQAPATSYFAEKGVACDALMCSEVADLSLADLESAKPSATFMANVMIAKKEKVRRAEAEGRKRAGAKPEGE